MILVLKRAPRLLVLATAVLASPPGFAHAKAAKHPTPTRVAVQAVAPTATPSNVPATESLLEHARYDAKRGAYFATLPEGGQAELTLDRDLQTRFDHILHDSRLEAGAIVAMDPRTGRILGMSQISRQPTKSVAMEAVYPAASVFKIVTAAALLEAGVDPSHEVCFHGGKRRLDAKNLVDDPRRDYRCASMSSAMGQSLNAVFGKLAERDLNPDRLRTMAGRFFFNQPLPLVPTPEARDALMSPADIPEEPLAFGRAAAGFGKVYMSPLHGALLASIVGNGGLAASPRLVEAVWNDGVRAARLPTEAERVIPESIAAQIGHMMRLTVEEGTARKAFHIGRHKALGDVAVAGKTGSLDDHAPFRDYTWFVGFAPAEDPTIAIAVVAVNGQRWTVRAPVVAREALQANFELDREHRRHAAR